MKSRRSAGYKKITPISIAILIIATVSWKLVVSNKSAISESVSAEKTSGSRFPIILAPANTQVEDLKKDRTETFQMKAESTNKGQDHNEKIALVRKFEDGTRIYKTNEGYATVLPDGKVITLPDQL